MREQLQRIAANNLVVAHWLNRLAATRHWLTDGLISPWQDAGTDYRCKTAPQCIEAQICDAATNLFLRVVLERKPKTLIEIGAYRGERIRALKRLLPLADCFALDIGENYKTRRSLDGVGLGPVGCLEDVLTPGSLVMSNGTLCYFAADDLRTLFAKLERASCALALSEPIAAYDNEISTKRSAISFHHPYVAMLEAAGFQICDETRSDYRMGLKERRLYLFAEPANSQRQRE